MRLVWRPCDANDGTAKVVACGRDIAMVLGRWQGTLAWLGVERIHDAPHSAKHL